MNLLKAKQPTIKPQDLIVALKIAVRPDWKFTYAQLSAELYMSVSEVHAAVKRAEVCRLISSSNGELAAIRSSLREFLVHGVQYTFPAVWGPLTRGIATGFAGPALKPHFNNTDGLSPVWPDVDGEARGLALQPLYHSVPAASRIDAKLYDVLTLADALRGGAARERELSANMLLEYLK